MANLHLHLPPFDNLAVGSQRISATSNTQAPTPIPTAFPSIYKLLMWQTANFCRLIYFQSGSDRASGDFHTD